MMRYELALLDKNHRDLHAMGRLYTKLELDRPAIKKVGNRDLKIPSTASELPRGTKKFVFCDFGGPLKL